MKSYTPGLQGGTAKLAEEIRELYLTIAARGSSAIRRQGFHCALQLIWTALAGACRQRRAKKPIYVISSDTLVETPWSFDTSTCPSSGCQAAAREQGMPILTHKVVPEVEQSFWVNLIGRGYPAPSREFRWCTERLKIEPANDFIKSRVAEFGEVVMVLGVRSPEFATRAQVMSLHNIKGSRLSRHSSLLNAFVYAPIADFSTDDVWTYLLQNPSPWGNDNRDLVAMYRNAASGECPLVVDTTTPSCGNSRFGCWVCTVVERDKAMEAMIDSGEEWLTPLLEFRDMLAETQDPRGSTNSATFAAGPAKSASSATRTGPCLARTRWTSAGSFCASFSRPSSRPAREAPAGEAPILIHEAELHEIRRLWRTERGDWPDSVPRIVREVLGRDLDWVAEDAVAFTADDGALLDAVCADHDVPTELVVKLLDIERAAHGLKRRHAVHTRIEELSAKTGVTSNTPHDAARAN